MFSKFAPIWVSASRAVSRRNFATSVQYTGKVSVAPKTVSEQIAAVKEAAAARAATITKEQLAAYDEMYSSVDVPTEAEINALKELPEFVCVTPKGFPVLLPTVSTLQQQVKQLAPTLTHEDKLALSKFFRNAAKVDPVAFYRAKKAPRGMFKKVTYGFVKLFILFIVLPYCAARITHPHLFASKQPQEAHSATAH